jgi:hypothetical protein
MIEAVREQDGVMKYERIKARFKNPQPGPFIILEPMLISD